MDYSEKHLHSSIKMWWLLPWDIHSSLQTKKYFSEQSLFLWSGGLQQLEIRKTPGVIIGAARVNSHTAYLGLECQDTMLLQAKICSNSF